MFFIPLYRIIKTAFQDFFRNFWLSFVTIIVVFLTLFSITVLLSLNVLANDAIRGVEEKIDIALIFKTTAKEEDILTIKDKIKTIKEVKDVIYVSKEEGLQGLIEKNPDIKKSVDLLDKNPLNAVLRIKAYNPTDFGKILTSIDTDEYNKVIEGKDQNFVESQEFVARLNNITFKIRVAGYILVALFVFISIIIVYSAITVSIYAHREEIAIMKLVGASNWFIRSPFVIMGVIYGVFATILTAVVVYPILDFLSPYIVQFMGSGELNILGYFNENFFYIFGIELVVICILNIISSSIAVGKYLRV